MAEKLGILHIVRVDGMRVTIRESGYLLSR